MALVPKKWVVVLTIETPFSRKGIIECLREMVSKHGLKLSVERVERLSNPESESERRPV